MEQALCDAIKRDIEEARKWRNMMISEAKRYQRTIIELERKLKETKFNADLYM